MGRFLCEWHTGAGKHSKNKREAEKHHALRLSEVTRRVYAKTVKIALEDFGRRYLEHAKAHKRSWKRDEQMLGHLQRLFGPANLTDITPLRVEGYQNKRVQEVCPATVNRELALLKHMFNMAERWSLAHGPNPVRLVKFLPEDNLQFQTLTEEEEQALLAACPPYLQGMIVFAIHTGLRSGDIFNLRWEEVDLEHRRLKLLVRKTRRMLELPLNEVAYAVLEGVSGIRKGPFV